MDSFDSTWQPDDEHIHVSVCLRLCSCKQFTVSFLVTGWFNRFQPATHPQWPLKMDNGWPVLCSATLNHQFGTRYACMCVCDSNGMVPSMIRVSMSKTLHIAFILVVDASFLETNHSCRCNFLISKAMNLQNLAAPAACSAILWSWPRALIRRRPGQLGPA